MPGFERFRPTRKVHSRTNEVDRSNRGDGIDMSAWIRMIPPEEATGRLAELYERVRTPHGTVDNVMRAHSLRPDSLEGHVALYRSVLHNEANTLPFWFLEAVATCVSLTNRCHYSTTHHSANMRRLLDDESRGEAMYAALACGHPEGRVRGEGTRPAGVCAQAHRGGRHDVRGGRRALARSRRRRRGRSSKSTRCARTSTTPTAS